MELIRFRYIMSVMQEFGYIDNDIQYIGVTILAHLNNKKAIKERIYTCANLRSYFGTRIPKPFREFLLKFIITEYEDGQLFHIIKHPEMCHILTNHVLETRNFDTFNRMHAEYPQIKIYAIGYVIEHESIPVLEFLHRTKITQQIHRSLISDYRNKQGVFFDYARSIQLFGKM